MLVYDAFKKYYTAECLRFDIKKHRHLRDFSKIEKYLFYYLYEALQNSTMASIPKRIERIERLVPD